MLTPKDKVGQKILIEEQKYLSNVLAAKRLMKDFVLATGAVNHKRHKSGPSDVAFMETGDREYATGCACGKKHLGGYMFCPNVTKEVQEQTIKGSTRGILVNDGSRKTAAQSARKEQHAETGRAPSEKETPSPRSKRTRRKRGRKVRGTNPSRRS